MKLTGIFILLLFVCSSSFAQRNSATVIGVIIDENEIPIPRVSITILGRLDGITSSDSGTFKINIPSQKAIALIFSHSGYRELKQNFYLSENEQEYVRLKMVASGKVLEEVIVKDEKERTETGLIKINPKSVIAAPSATGGVEGLIKILVGSNNELTSQYSVRGGNYDENLIYINDFEIYRPFLIRNGQQEGLSFINPEMVKNIQFYNGGFQAKYGDKISSVLDIQYRNPVKSGGSVYIGLLEQGVHFEGANRNKKLTWLIGARTKSNKNLLSSQETKGNYTPSASDLQAFLTYKISDKFQLEILGLVSGSAFSLVPESAQKSTAVFSPLFTANIGLDIFFEGQEKDSYNNNFLGLSLLQKVNNKVKLKWMASRYGDKISSVLDIQYKTPIKSGGSVYIGLLEQGVHFEGITTNKKLTWLIGAR
ncbi:MAG: TonB-dependent receptor, partial [Ginsengibacter sp.]